MRLSPLLSCKTEKCVNYCMLKHQETLCCKTWCALVPATTVDAVKAKGLGRPERTWYKHKLIISFVSGVGSFLGLFLKMAQLGQLGLPPSCLSTGKATNCPYCAGTVSRRIHHVLQLVLHQRLRTQLSCTDAERRTAACVLHNLLGQVHKRSQDARPGFPIPYNS